MSRPHPLIAVHGGAGSKTLTAAQRSCLGASLEAGVAELLAGAPAASAVECAIRLLEASGLFNAGSGARRQLDGVRRLDASIMEGRGLKAGAVAAVEGIRHPITVARLVSEETDHVLLVGRPASRFARYFRVERDEPRPNDKRSRKRREAARGRSRSVSLYRAMYGPQVFGTVGAVALDQAGTVAAGASTGGIALMLPGRVGDTPLIGCGVYADNEGGAVSMTGLGESIIRMASAKSIVGYLSQGQSPRRAAGTVLMHLVKRIKGEAGALVLSASGVLSIQHTTPRMAAGYWSGRGRPVVGDCFTRSTTFRTATGKRRKEYE